MPVARRTLVWSVACAGLACGLVFSGACSSDSASAVEGDGGSGGATNDDGGGELADGGRTRDATLSTDANDVSSPFTGLDCGASTSTCVVALAAGGGHVCALLGGATVRCWGQNYDGELGGGSLDAGHVSPAATPVPAAVLSLEAVVQIAAGGYSTGSGLSCAQPADGGVMCWGSNTAGALGLGPDDGGAPARSLKPLPLGLGNVEQLALGGLFSCALTAGGLVSCWGDDGELELGRALDAGSFDPKPTRVVLPTAASAVTTGIDHACALLVDHSVACWGSGGNGQIGQVTGGGRAEPTRVQGVSATQVVAGGAATCAITETGGVACWGANQSGQLGRGTADAAALDPTPGPVALPPGAQAIALAGAVGSMCALLADRTVWCWGDNAYGELGTSSSTLGLSTKPVRVSTLSNVVQLAAGPGGWNVCALVQDGSVWCWGVNYAHQLGVDTSGDGGADESPHPAPLRVVVP